MPYEHETKTQLAVRALREKIRSGEMGPGTRIRLQALTEELDMSPTPIREALRLLEADGLIVYTPHVGIEVAELESDEVGEIYMLREALEPLAVELAVPRMDAAALRDLDRLHRQLMRAIDSGKGSAISQVNADWHWAIYKRADARYLQEFIERLWHRFPWRTTWALPERLEITKRDHEAIMGAIHGGDAARATRLMREHIAGGRDSTFAGMLALKREEKGVVAKAG